ncbi:MAG: DUF456 domain-containing protein [Flavobacteriaceae bacterium]|nr:MAG: DUF456 domain-containing protein [Flavobacteriaceae bacterium]
MHSMEDSTQQYLSLFIMVIGLFGIILPFVPGVSLVWLGFLLFKFTQICTYSWTTVFVALGFTLFAFAMEYVVPILGTKKMGGTRYGVIGAMIGLVMGASIGFGVGVLFMPFIGAFIGELLYDGQDFKRAFKASLGTIIGFMLTTGINILVASWMLILAFKDFGFLDMFK